MPILFLATLLMTCVLASIPLLMGAGIWVPCSLGAGCQATLAATRIGPVPVSWAGYIYAVSTLGLASVAGTHDSYFRFLRVAIAIGAVAATGFQVYAWVVLQTFCPWCMAIWVSWLASLATQSVTNPDSIRMLLKRPRTPCFFIAAGALAMVPPLAVRFGSRNLGCSVASEEYAEAVAIQLGQKAMEGHTFVFIDFGCLACATSMGEIAKDARRLGKLITFIPITVKNVTGNDDTAILHYIAGERGYGTRVIERPPNPSTILEYNESLADELAYSEPELKAASQSFQRGQKAALSLGVQAVPAALRYEKGQLCRASGVEGVRKLAGLPEKRYRVP